jgi:hypothetical protein
MVPRCAYGRGVCSMKGAYGVCAVARAHARVNTQTSGLPPACSGRGLHELYCDYYSGRADSAPGHCKRAATLKSVC